MNIYVDTSAFLALADPNDSNHAVAKETWSELLEEPAMLACTNYVILEAISLLQRRFGMEAMRDFQESIVPLLQIIWIDEAFHQAGVDAMLAANRRRLSLVDITSFAAARQFNIKTVFAFDQHFVEQGFKLAQAVF